MIAVSEAFVLAEKLGLDHQKLFDISSKSSGQCWSLTTYCPVPGPVPTSPANRDYQAGFTAAMMLKDLKLSQDAAKATRTKTELGADAERIYSLFVASGDAAVRQASRPPSTVAECGRASPLVRRARPSLRRLSCSTPLAFCIHVSGCEALSSSLRIGRTLEEPV